MITEKNSLERVFMHMSAFENVWNFFSSHWQEFFKLETGKPYAPYAMSTSLAEIKNILNSYDPAQRVVYWVTNLPIETQG